MANLRVIKKDIVFLVNEVISDCWVYLQLNPECDQAPVEQIIADAVALGDQTFDKVNHAPKERKKAYFREANKALLEGIDSLFERLSALKK